MTTGPSSAPPTQQADGSGVDSLDVMVLQTAASLENLLVGAYTTLAARPFVESGDALFRAFVARTVQQHAEHARAFNAAAARVGGAVQDAADPRYAASVARNLATLTDPVAVAGLMTTLEDVAAQTYTRYVGLAGTTATRVLFAGVAPVEAQHCAILRVMQSLLGGGSGDLLALPTTASRLSAATGTVGLPPSPYPTAGASAIDEGSVR